MDGGGNKGAQAQPQTLWGLGKKECRRVVCGLSVCLGMAAANKSILWRERESGPDQ